jgi:cytochrome c551/c552
MNIILPNSFIRQSLFTLLLIFILQSAYSQDGEKIFKTRCIICHTIGSGTLLGPDLTNIHTRRDKDWIFSFIRSSQTMVKNGDETAVALFEEFNKIMMPDHPDLTDGDLNSLLAYIEKQSTENVEESETSLIAVDDVALAPDDADKSIDTATDEDILNGRMLFSGERRLENRGPACNSCHNVVNDRLLGGGLLAKDLTAAFSRLNENGIKAMVSNPPFPAMRQAYGNHPVTSDEAFLLTAFLQSADKAQYNQHHRDYKAIFLYAGIIGFAILLLLFTMVWRKRKRASVNQKIYSRQLKSVSY